MHASAMPRALALRKPILYNKKSDLQLQLATPGSKLFFFFRDITWLHGALAVEHEELDSGALF